MSYNIEYFKNKFKRFLIEVHHRKNKVGYSEHIIKSRDPNKPLITLRVDNNYSDDDDIESELSIDQEFEGFTNSARLDKDEKEISTNVQLTTTNAVSRISSFERRGSYTSSRPPTPIVTNSEINQVQNLLDMEEHQKRLEKSLQNNISYIKKKELPPRRRFWFFGKRYPQLEQKNSEIKEQIELIDEEDDKLSDEIELIAHSNNEKKVEKTELSFQESLDAQEFFNFQISDKLSSYSRKKHNVSLISLSKPSSRDTCACAACSKKHNQQVEPWKVIMNDISLHAALLSTGAKPQLQYQSFNNLVADFTSSKHQINQNRVFSNQSIPSELVSLQSQELMNFGKFSVMHDENRVLESDLLEFSNPSTKRLKNQTTSKPLSRQSENSILTALLNTGQATSALYDDVFQNYEYSDESEAQRKPKKGTSTFKKNDSEDQNSESSEIQPLRLSNRGLKQLF